MIDRRQRPVALFTDYGLAGPYVGQVKAVLAAGAPHAPIIDLMADAPRWDPKASAYLLAALVPEMSPGVVLLCVVDPGVGGDRAAVVVEADGRWLVGPDNGLFELVGRRAGRMRAWRIERRPERLSVTFHGRDLFAPVAADLAAGRTPEQAGCVEAALVDCSDWPDDLAQVVYVDSFGNVMTGLRGGGIDPGARFSVGAHLLTQARTFSDRPIGLPFWYVNSIGLVEFAANRGRADRILGLAVGDLVS